MIFITNIVLCITWSCQKVCETLTFLLDNIYIRFDFKLYRQIVDIPMGTNCAPFVTDLYLLCYERGLMLLTLIPGCPRSGLSWFN